MAVLSAGSGALVPGWNFIRRNVDRRKLRWQRVNPPWVLFGSAGLCPVAFRAARWCSYTTWRQPMTTPQVNLCKFLASCQFHCMKLHFIHGLLSWEDIILIWPRIGHPNPILESGQITAWSACACVDWGRSRCLINDQRFACPKFQQCNSLSTSTVQWLAKT